jgi:PAS domain S-box-containing protein
LPLDEQGRERGFIKIARDETDRQASEAALAASEAYLRIVLDNAVDGLYGIDTDGVTTFCNKAFLRMLGFAREEDAIGRKLHDIIHHSHPDGSPYHRQDCPIYTAAHSGADVHVDDEIFFRLDGTSFPVEYWVRPISTGGEIQGSVCTFVDLTERKAAEEALRTSEAQLRELNRTLERRVEHAIADRDRTWNNARDLLLVVGSDGTIRAVNPAWQAILGWQSDELVGRSYFDFVDPGDETSSREALALASGNDLPDYENRYRHKDGSYRLISWVAASEGDMIYASGRDVTREKERAAALRLFENIVQSDNSPVCAFNKDFRLTAFNQAHSDEFFRIFGHRVQPGEVFPDLFPPDQAPIMRGFMARALAGETYTVVEEFGDPDLAKPYWEVAYSPLRDEAGRIVGAFHHARDISARLRAEAELLAAQEALRQSQKMEAVGQLTGGIAHDFNNLLTGVIGSLDMMQRRMAQGQTDRIDHYTNIALTAANRAAALTHRLLAFSRRQPLDPQPIDANRLVTGTEELLRRTIGESIRLEIVTAGGLWQTMCDPHQLENAILNLAINARDAMPQGGTLTIETSNAHHDDVPGAPKGDVRAGQYVCIAVSDTGTGMPPEVMEKAFDPFFTTKPIGQGTGLGLSMIYGFARQSEGHAKIDSTEGEGTTVKLFLPRSQGEVVEAEEEGEEPGDAKRAEAGEVVLVVEDETAVRELVVDVLQELGYRAVEAGDGDAGLKLLRSDIRIDLLVTDIGLPGLNGRELAEAARALRPDLKVLFMTGYAQNATPANGFMDPGMQMMTKPFAIDALATRIREMIEHG